MVVDIKVEARCRVVRKLLSIPGRTWVAVLWSLIEVDARCRVVCKLLSQVHRPQLHALRHHQASTKQAVSPQVNLFLGLFHSAAHPPPPPPRNRPTVLATHSLLDVCGRSSFARRGVLPSVRSGRYESGLAVLQPRWRVVPPMRYAASSKCPHAAPAAIRFIPILLTTLDSSRADATAAYCCCLLKASLFCLRVRCAGTRAVGSCAPDAAIEQVRQVAATGHGCRE